MAEMNAAYIAHVVADSPDGPRGDLLLSTQLASDLSNLMLLCDVHHRLVDREDVAGHPADRLRDMKGRHEARIELLTSLQEDRKSHVILYGANIGDHRAQISDLRAFQAMTPDWYPADILTIRLGLGNSPFTDAEDIAWRIERESLARQFAEQVKPRLGNGDGHHFSVFALAPQPLLIELGRLLSDIPAVEVYQLHREPPDWRWQEHTHSHEYVMRRPETRHKCIALNLSLSATITEARIAEVMPCDYSVWTLTVLTPGNDLFKSRLHLRSFRERFRAMLNEIKAEHGEDAVIHIFPAVPVSVAVEIGRTWMPKADLSLRVYDQNRKRGGFVHALNFARIA